MKEEGWFNLQLTSDYAFDNQKLWGLVGSCTGIDFNYPLISGSTTKVRSSGDKELMKLSSVGSLVLCSATEIRSCKEEKLKQLGWQEFGYTFGN